MLEIMRPGGNKYFDYYISSDLIDFKAHQLIDTQEAMVKARQIGIKKYTALGV